MRRAIWESCRRIVEHVGVLGRVAVRWMIPIKKLGIAGLPARL